MSNRVMLSARVPEELKDLVDADRRSNQEVLEAALWREFGGERKSVLERKADEKRRRISVIESERNERERELEREEDRLEAIESKIESLENKADREEQKREELFESLRNTPADTSMGRVIHVADELDMTKQEVVNEMQARFDK